MPPERLTPLDASFLYLEGPSTHMHVAALSVFDPSSRADDRLPFEDVRATIASRLHLAPRFRRRVVEVPMRLALPVWVDDERFDLDLHVRRIAVPAPGGRGELTELVQDLLSRPLDRRRPLWELTVLEGLEGGHVATLMKVHHALMDGISGMQLASAMYDLGAERTPAAGVPAWRPEPPPTPAQLVREALRDGVREPIRAASDAARLLAGSPGRAASEASSVASGLRDLVDLGPPRSAAFRAPVGPNRRLAITQAPFEQFRRLSSSLGGTVNDVVLTVAAGALHGYLRERGERTRGVDLRVLVPVSVRSGDDAFGNHVAPAFVDVPVGAMGPKRRLSIVRERTRRLKASSMVTGVDALIGLGGLAPAALLAPTARAAAWAAGFNVVVSNVPGPLQPLYLAGARLVASYPSLPLGPTSTLSIACTSLGGAMAFGLTADRDALPDIDRLAFALEEALAEASKAVDA